VNSLAVGLAALGLSGAVHAAVLLAPIGHGSPDRGTGEVLVAVDATEVTVAPPELPVPEPTVTPPAGHATTWPTHTHPYPVPADHDWTPHDPNLVHPHAQPNATADTPAQAAPALTTDDDSPHFTIAIGTGDDANGAVLPGGTAPPHDDSSEPLAQQSVDAQARLVMGLAPSYPDAARAEGIEGDVRLELVVGVSGAVESARVVRGVGHGLDEAALRAVRQFRFAPATKANHPVRVRMGWSMQFRLQ
jgi:protein TonB